MGFLVVSFAISAAAQRCLCVDAFGGLWKKARGRATLEQGSRWILEIKGSYQFRIYIYICICICICLDIYAFRQETCDCLAKSNGVLIVVTKGATDRWDGQIQCQTVPPWYSELTKVAQNKNWWMIGQYFGKNSMSILDLSEGCYITKGSPEDWLVAFCDPTNLSCSSSGRRLDSRSIWSPQTPVDTSVECLRTLQDKVETPSTRPQSSASSPKATKSLNKHLTAVRQLISNCDVRFW